MRLHNGRAGSSDIYFGVERIVLDAQKALTWRYWDGEEKPSAELNAWAAPDFDDSAWASAEGSFGAVRGELTTLSGGFLPQNLLNQYYEGTTTNIETFFFRSTVTLDTINPDAYSYVARAYYDDGLSLYVNGEYAGGAHDGGLFDHENADRIYGGSNQGSPNLAEIHIDPSLLKAGENTFAFRLRQGRASSSDLYFEYMGLVENTEAPDAFNNVVLHMGAEGDQRNLAFYTSTMASEGVKVEIARTDALTDDQFPAGSEVEVKQSASAIPMYNVNHAFFTDLEAGVSYTYRLSNADGELATHEFTTVDEGEFSFFYIGDAQIGSSGNAVRDGEGWQNTIDVAQERYPEVNILVSGGDQVETASNETEYLHYPAPLQMKELAHVATVGNHDVGAPRTYAEHFNLPNYDADLTRNHWWGQNDILFLHMNTEHRNWGNHRAWLEGVLAEQGDNYAQYIVVIHRGLYSVANHSQSSTTDDIRKGLTPIFHDNNIEIVLAGHDHSYARSHVVNGYYPGT